jgi:hypothetical protein
METTKPTSRKATSKGGAIFQRILEDKKAIQKHLASGGKLSDLKKKYPFVTPI